MGKISSGVTWSACKDITYKKKYWRGTKFGELAN